MRGQDYSLINATLQGCPGGRMVWVEIQTTRQRGDSGTAVTLWFASPV